jgi:hypothetical protein
MARELNRPITIDNVYGRVLPPDALVANTYKEVRRRLVPIDGAEPERVLVSQTFYLGTADNVYATPAITAQLDELRGLPITQETKQRRAELRKWVLASLRQLYNRTRKRRDDRTRSTTVEDTGSNDITVRGNGYIWTLPNPRPEDGKEYLDDVIMPIKSRLFTRGRSYVLRLLLANGREKIRKIINYDPTRLDVVYFFAVDNDSDFVLENPALNETNFWITPINDIPVAERNRLNQYYRDSVTGSCVADAIIYSLKKDLDANKSVRQNERLIRSLTKIAKKYPEGMSVEMIQEHIVDKLSLPLVIKHLLPIPSEDIPLKPKRTLSKNGNDVHFMSPKVVINTRPNHVDIYAVSAEKTVVSRDEFNDLRRKYVEAKTPVWIQERNDNDDYNKQMMIISNEGTFVVDTEKMLYFSTFYEQFQDHMSIFNTLTHSNTESYMLDYQALEFCSSKRLFQTGKIYEYDQDASYTQYPHGDAGYLLYGEDVCIDFVEMGKVISTIDLEEFEVLIDISFTKLSDLYKLLEFPEAMVCPSWFFMTYILPYTQGIVKRYEVRKKFYMDMEKVKEDFLSAYEEEDRRWTPMMKSEWKRTYVCLFGLTGRRSKDKIYALQGEASYEYIQFLQSRVKDELVKFKECDNDGIKSYLITVSKEEIQVCPQILNARTLYSLAVNLDTALQYPLSTIAMITLDSIGLTFRLHEPLYKMKLKIHQNNMTVTEPLEYSF